MARRVKLVKLDMAKSVFQINGADWRGRATLYKGLRRRQLNELPARLRSCMLGIQAIRDAHYRARMLSRFARWIFRTYRLPAVGDLTDLAWVLRKAPGKTASAQIKHLY